LIGSVNASQSSANALIEAVIEVDDGGSVRACHDFVLDLSGEVVTPAYAKRMQGLYKPPQFRVAPRHRQKDRTRPVSPQHPPLWAVPLGVVTLSNRARVCAEAGRLAARRKMQSPRASWIDEFYWKGAEFLRRVDESHQVLQVTDEGRGKQMLSPCGHVLHVERYQERTALCGIVFVEISKALPRKNHKFVTAKLGPEASLPDRDYSTTLRSFIGC
jgi:hypothetical protein